MDEKKETSSELSSEPPPSIPGLSDEKRNEDGSEEKDELQGLDSEVKPSTVLNTSTCVVPKASSVSKDDDRSVTNALPHETPIGKDDDSNYCETPRGVHVDDVVSNNNSSVLKPKEVVTPRDDSGSLEKQDSMRRWMEMKQNGFLTGALGGPVASRQRKSKRRNRNVVPKKQDQKLVVVDKFSNVVTPPSGLLTGSKPGILKHVRSKEQVYSALEALIQNADFNVRDSTRQEDSALASKLSDYAISEQAKSLAVQAATFASQWLEFLHQDLRERLTAVKESRNRVDDTLKAELPLVVSSSKESSSANQGSRVTEAQHQMKWYARFDGFKKDLNDDEKDLEHSLNQVKDMQSRCNEGLRQMNESSCGKDGETNLAVQAAAASIFSTCRFILSKMKPPSNSS